jgi:hypothetical protein
MHSPDRYALALAMLEGDRDARKILADLLEEQGDRGLAQWARAAKRRQCDRLDFTLAVLSWPLTLRLGLDFFMHCRHELPPIGDSREEVRQIPVLQQWCVCAVSRAAAEEACQKLGELRARGEQLARFSDFAREQRHWLYYYHDRSPLANLIDAVRSALQRSHPLDSLEGLAHAPWRHEIIAPVRRAVRRIGLVSLQIDALAWQVEQAKMQLRRLMKGDSWPK